MKFTLNLYSSYCIPGPSKIATPIFYRRCYWCDTVEQMDFSPNNLRQTFLSFLDMT